MKSLSYKMLLMLRRGEKVALPGVGYFVLKYVPAHFDRENSSFFPPYFTTVFTHDEEAVTNAIPSSEVNDLKTLLNQKGKASLPGLGTLMLSDGEYTFYSSLAFNPQLPVLDLARETEEVEEEPSTGKVRDAHSETLPEIKEVIIEKIPQNYHYRNPAYFYVPVHKKMIKIAACFLLVATVAIAALLPIGRSGAPASTAAIIPMNIPVKTSPQKTSSGYDVSENLKGAKESTETTQEIISREDKCFAVVAAFKTEREINDFLNSNSGENAFQIIQKGTVRLVSVASASTLDNLEEQMPEIRASYPDAWIYTIPE